MTSALPSAAVALIAAMITPALLILASASLVASTLVRMARVVDRARFLATVAHERTWEKLGISNEQLKQWIRAHEQRARSVETSIAVLYAAIVAFVATCLSLALDRATGNQLAWFPVALAIFGTGLLLIGGALMVHESRLSGRQIVDETRLALLELERTNDV